MPAPSLLLLQQPHSTSRSTEEAVLQWRCFSQTLIRLFWKTQRLLPACVLSFPESKEPLWNQEAICIDLNTKEAYRKCSLLPSSNFPQPTKQNTWWQTRLLASRSCLERVLNLLRYEGIYIYIFYNIKSSHKCTSDKLQ